MAYNHGIKVMLGNDDTSMMKVYAATGQKLKSQNRPILRKEDFQYFNVSSPANMPLRVVIPMVLSNPGSSTSYPSSP